MTGVDKKVKGIERQFPAMQKQKESAERGYTLVELSISVSIIALLVTGGMVVIAKKDEAERRRDTYQTLQKVEKALKEYVLHNGALPCPAIGNILNSDASYGVASLFDDTTRKCTTEAGMIPVRTLKLPEDLAFDGWHRKFSYVVSEGMGSNKSFDDPNYAGEIVVVDLTGREKTSVNALDQHKQGGAYVIVSHGPNGTGAWLKDSTAAPSSASGDEAENADHSTDKRYIQDRATATFDDIVSYKRKYDLKLPRISESPILLTKEACDNANHIVDNGPPKTTAPTNPLGEFTNLNAGAYASVAEQYYETAIKVKLLCDNPPLDIVYPTPWGAVLPLSTISQGDGTEGFVLEATSINEFVGDSVRGVGDVNGDGYDDVIIGATGHSGGEGGAYIIFGKESSWNPIIKGTDITGGAASEGVFLMGSHTVGQPTGDSVTGVGDINGDGIDDLFVNKPSSSSAYGGYVVFGKQVGWTATMNLSSIDSTSSLGFRVSISGIVGTSRISVAGNGDVNNDGVNDLVLGVEATDLDENGSAYVIFGKSGGFGSTTNIDVSALDGTNGFRISGEAPDYKTGYSVAMGDINSDGVEDVIVGAPGMIHNTQSFGGAYVIFGKADWSGSATLPVSALNGVNGFKFAADDGSGANGDGAEAGRSVAAGDINNDGVDDLMVGAPYAWNGFVNSGEVYVFFGQTGWSSGALVDAGSSTLDGTTGFTLQGTGSGDEAGMSVDAMADINGDGIDDIIIGAPSKEGIALSSADFLTPVYAALNTVKSFFIQSAYAMAPQPQGVGYVVFGKASGTNWPSVFDLSNLREGDGSTGFEIHGENANEKAHASVAGAGDVNGDGFHEIIVGAPEAYYDGTLNQGGRAYVIFGH